MGKYSYLLVDIIFYLPVFLFLFGFFRKKIFQFKKLIIMAFLIGVVYFFIVEPFAMSWKTWEYRYDLTFGPIFGLAVVEELIWVSLGYAAIMILVNILAPAEEKGEKFINLIKSK